MKREEFIRGTGRWTVLALLAGLFAIILGKRHISLGPSCSYGDFCRECKKFDACDRPQAKEQR